MPRARLGFIAKLPEQIERRKVLRAARATANEDSGAAPVILDQQTVFERLCYSYKIDDTTTIADAKSLLPAAIQMRGDTVNIPMFVAPDVALLVALICVAYQRGLSEHTAVKEAVADVCGSNEWQAIQPQLAGLF